MTWSSMRGRPRDLPVDRTPLRGAHVDGRARIAWLVRVSRMASPVGGTGRDFSHRLTAAGFPVGASALSRREHGQEEISGAMLSAYETVLELPIGQLRSVCRPLRRLSAPHEIVRPEPIDRADLSVRLSRLEERIASGEACATDWLTLAQMLVQGGVVLPPSVLQHWVDQLLSEMLRSVGTAYVGRFEALAQMMRDRVTRRSVVSAVMSTVDTPGSGCTIDALSVLGESGDMETVDRMVDLFEHRTQRIRLGAARALLQQIVLGRLTVDQVDRIQHAILTVAREDPDDGGWPSFMLAQRISLPMTRMVVALLGTNPGNRPHGAYIQDPALLHRYLRAAADDSGVHDDRMLERLVREALTEDFLERQHHSSLMLMASPYREVLAETAVDIVAAVDDPVAREAAGGLLSYLGTIEQRPRLLGLLACPEADVQHIALRALAHAGGVPADVDLGSRLTRPELARTTLYAAGMSGHPVLESAVRSPEATETVRAGARWWIRAGSAVRDAPGDHRIACGQGTPDEPAPPDQEDVDRRSAAMV